jgi:hypothetical protein
MPYIRKEKLLIHLKSVLYKIKPTLLIITLIFLILKESFRGVIVLLFIVILQGKSVIIKVNFVLLFLYKELLLYT